MKYSADQETKLMTEMWSMNIKDDPYNFVKFTFPWGVKDTPLEDFKGPRKWQEKILREITTHIQRNQRLDMPEMFRLAVASGRGIGKSALVAWLILWMLSTRLGSTIIVTANTEQQLRSRTWAELGKWLTLAINSHWFSKTATTIKPAQWFEEALIRDLKIDTGYYYAQAQLWSEENPDAFAGIHSNYGVCLIMDEASGIPSPIYSVSEGFFSEPTKDRYWFCFSNPRRNTGPFYDCFNSNRQFWRTEQIDSRNVEGTDKELFQRMIEQYGEDSTVSRVEVMGEFPRADDDTVIPMELVRAAVERDVALTAGEPILWGLDVARFGGDVIGLGAGVVDRLREQNLPVRGVNVSEAPSTKKNYLNLRAELWFSIKDWLAGRDCRIPNDDELVAELASPSYKYTSTGKIKIESKEEMKRRGLKSPDKADALALTMAGSAASFSGSQSFMGYNFNKPLKSRILRVG